MAAGIFDININEGDTFVLSLEFWSNEDNTIPLDLTLIEFSGAFQIGSKYIPMVCTKSTDIINVMTATVSYSQMTDLSTQGKYDIDSMQDGERFRVIQGSVKINKEVTV